MARRRWMAWAALGAAFLAFELAVDLSVALPMACLLFGWNDAATAWWCVRRDQCWLRGWLATGLYSTSAWLKVGLGAFALMIAVGAIAGSPEAPDRSAIGPGRGEPPAFVMSLIFVAVGSLMAAWGLANLTCGLALWKRRKLWLGPEAGLARRQGVWPPWAADESKLDWPGPTNRVNLVVWLAIIPWISVAILMEGWAWALLLGDNGWMAGLLLGSVITTVSVVLWNVVPRIAPRVLASSPFEAWELEAP